MTALRSASRPRPLGALALGGDPEVGHEEAAVGWPWPKSRVIFRPPSRGGRPQIFLRAALFFTRAYNRLLRPASAAALPGISAVANPLKRAFANVDAQLTKWINHAHLAA